MKRILSILTLVLVVSHNVALADTTKFGLTDFAGKAVSLEQFTGNGKWKVVMLWASDCHACNTEAEQYIQFHEANKDKQISLLGISMDGRAKLDAAKAFVERHHVTFPNIIGEFNSVAMMYEELTGGSWLGTPTILVFNPKGELKAAQPGAVPVNLIEDFITSQSSATTDK